MANPQQVVQRTSYAAVQLVLSPPLFQQPGIASFVRGLATEKDILEDRTRQAVKARFATLSPPDALAQIGRERQMDRGPGESDAAYAARLQGAWTAWPWAGTAFGILTQLAALGYTDVIVAPVNGKRYFTLVGGALVITAIPTGSWEVDAPPQSFWSKFQTVFVQPLPVAWLAGGTTAVFHGGGGTGVITFAGTPVIDARILVQINGSGGAGAATYKWSQDNGATFSGLITSSGSATALGATGITVTFGAGVFAAGDSYTTSPTFNVPADNSNESLRIKKVVNLWKPAHSTSAGYAFITRGESFGYHANILVPNKNFGYIGGSASATWTP